MQGTPPFDLVILLSIYAIFRKEKNVPNNGKTHKYATKIGIFRQNQIIVVIYLECWYNRYRIKQRRQKILWKLRNLA